MKHFHVFVALAAGLAASTLPVRAQTGTDALRKAARAAVVRYERTARWLAPGTYAGSPARCDEVVGRFCLTFDSLSKPPQRPERREVGEAREAALATLRALAAAAPGDSEAAGPLVRLLVEARRGEAAVAAAEQYAAATRDSLQGDWLSGYALHAAGRDGEAAARFERALARLPAAERAKITAIDWLLSPGERGRLGRLRGEDRDRYVERFWRLADPQWRTRENEVWVEHVARHVEAALLAKVPLVPGMLHWGRDLDELTIRYGAPIARERDYGSDSWSFIEHFDTSALWYAPESLRPDELAPLQPGESWRLESPSARSSHSPFAIRAAVPLAHQLTRIPLTDSMLVRLDAEVQLDSARSAEAVLVAWPWHGGTELRASAAVPDSARAVTLELRVPRDTLVYSAELFEPAGRKLHRARYLLEPLSPARLQLSDILLTRAIPDSGVAAGRFTPLTSLLVPPAAPVGIRVVYLGVRAGEPIGVDVSFARAHEPSLLGRAAGWLGRRFGLGAESSPPRASWQDVAGGEGVLHVNLVTPARPGLYYVQVSLRAAAGRAVTRRLVRVVSGSGAGS